MAKIPNLPQFTPKTNASGGGVAFSSDDWHKLRTAMDDIIRALSELNNEVNGPGSGSGDGYPPQLGHSRI